MGKWGKWVSSERAKKKWTLGKGKGKGERGKGKMWEQEKWEN